MEDVIQSVSSTKPGERTPYVTSNANTLMRWWKFLSGVALNSYDKCKIVYRQTCIYQDHQQSASSIVAYLFLILSRYVFPSWVYFRKHSWRPHPLSACIEVTFLDFIVHYPRLTTICSSLWTGSETGSEGLSMTDSSRSHGNSMSALFM